MLKDLRGTSVTENKTQSNKTLKDLNRTSLQRTKHSVGNKMLKDLRGTSVTENKTQSNKTLKYLNRTSVTENKTQSNKTLKDLNKTSLQRTKHSVGNKTQCLSQKPKHGVIKR